MNTKAFFDPNTFNMTYVISDPKTQDAVIIDPVLDFNPLTWRTTTTSADQVRQYVTDKSLNVKYILDTHAHADHLSGIDVLRTAYQAPTAMGKKITDVQKLFAGAYNLDTSKYTGALWDTLLGDNDSLQAGSITIKAIHTPGHTPACMTYKIGDLAFVGDALFMPDYGTGRCDFPSGSASDLYDSVHGKLYKLDDSTKVFVGHDYQPGGRALEYETTIGDSKKNNIRLKESTSKGDFIAARKARDAELPPPKLILQSLQVNIKAGQLPEPENNGRVYFKIPVNFLGS